jgi:hypothetical protein
VSHSFGRWTRLAALGTGVAAAAAIAFATAGTALADPTDGTGTATITFNTKFLSHLAKWGIYLLPESPATSSDTNGYDAYTFTVTGGNGSDTNFTGNVNLGGRLTLIDGITGQAVHLTNLALDYFDGVLTGTPEGTTTPIWIADIAGNLATSNATGTETFTASNLTLDPQGTTYLNTTLKSTTTSKKGKTFSAFTPGTTTSGKNAFTTTYTVTIT